MCIDTNAKLLRDVNELGTTLTVWKVFVRHAEGLFSP